MLFIRSLLVDVVVFVVVFFFFWLCFAHICFLLLSIYSSVEQLCLLCVEPEKAEQNRTERREKNNSKTKNQYSKWFETDDCVVVFLFTHIVFFLNWWRFIVCEFVCIWFHFSRCFFIFDPFAFCLYPPSLFSRCFISIELLCRSNCIQINGIYE